MSENVQPSNVSFDDYIELVGDIRIANHINNKEMDRMFDEILVKAQEYRNRWLQSETRVETMKNIITKQYADNISLHKQLEEMTKKLHNAETKAQANEIKFNRMYNRLKAVILDTAADKDAAA